MKKALSLYFQNELHFKILRNNVFYSHKVNLKEQERNKTIILQIIDKITQGRPGGGGGGGHARCG